MAMETDRNTLELWNDYTPAQDHSVLIALVLPVLVLLSASVLVCFVVLALVALVHPPPAVLALVLLAAAVLALPVIGFHAPAALVLLSPVELPPVLVELLLPVLLVPVALALVAPAIAQQGSIPRYLLIDPENQSRSIDERRMSRGTLIKLNDRLNMMYAGV